MGAPWGVPWVPKFLPPSKKSLAPPDMVLKSVTTNKQGCRNEFFKGSLPWKGSMGAPWVGPWDSQIFTTIKKVTGTSRKWFEISHNK